MDQQRYLLVFGPKTAILAPLPAGATVYLRRSRDGGLECGEHDGPGEALVRLTMGEEVVIEPLVGQILLNDERLEEGRDLRSGDEIGLGQHGAAVFHSREHERAVQGVLRPDELHQRLRQEVERCLRYHRPLSLLLLRLNRGEAGPGFGELARTVARTVRAVDIVGWVGQGELVVLFPETGQSALVPAARIMAAIGSEARGGLARCPADGTASDTLIVGARSAALRAPTGKVEPMWGGESTLRVGELQVVAVDPKTRRLFELVRDLAPSDIPVLITGETGVGKELVAHALHHWSARREAPLVTLNCAALPESLLESELFGHERGAFSGAETHKQGLLESANGGTLFLDEISEASPAIQAKLLRVLETGRARRLGAVAEHPIDLRIVSATNRALEQELEAGRFREDLYYRLNVGAVEVPPLRDRKLDLPELTRRLLAQACQRQGRGPIHVADRAMERLLSWGWPGNVRELRNVVDRTTAVLPGDLIEVEDLPPQMGPARQREDTPPACRFRRLADEIRELERTRMMQALTASGGVHVRASELISMPLRTFVTKLKVHGLNTGKRLTDPG